MSMTSLSLKVRTLRPLRRTTSKLTDSRIDDPYYYLYYGKAPRVPSYFALELEEKNVGRVIRFDSLSKILSAGIRIGFVSGPEAILRSIDMHVRLSRTSTSYTVLPLETTVSKNLFLTLFAQPADRPDFPTCNHHH